MAPVCLTQKQKEQAVVSSVWKDAIYKITDTFETRKRMTKTKTAGAIGVGRNTWTSWQNGKTGDFESVVIALYRAGYEIKIEKR